MVDFLKLGMSSTIIRFFVCLFFPFIAGALALSSPSLFQGFVVSICPLRVVSEEQHCRVCFQSMHAKEITVDIVVLDPGCRTVFAFPPLTEF